MALPWQVLDPASRWMVAIVLALDVIGSVLTWIFFDRGNTLIAGTLLALGIMFVWGFALSQCLALANTARSLRLPHALREAYACLGLYVLVSVVIPALVLTLAGGTLPMAVAGLLMAAALGLLLALLPSYVYFFMMAAYFSTLVVSHWLPASALSLLPHPKDADFGAWLMVFCAGLVTLAVARWWQACAKPISPHRLRRPMIGNLSPALGAQHRTHSLVPDERIALRQSPEWIQPTIVLHNTGPAHLRTSLRVALGAHWLPIAGTSRLRQSLLTLAFIGGLVLLFGLLNADGEDELPWWTLLTDGGGWFVLLGGLLAALSVASMLKQRWSHHNAELPLMALLPGLGPTGRVKRALLQLTLGQAVLTWVPLWLLSWLLVSWGNGQVSAPLSAVIGVITFLGLLLNLAQVLGILGHRRVPFGDKLVLMAYLPLLTLASGAWALAVYLGDMALPTALAWLLVLGWALLLLPLGRAIVQGWRGFRALPHAFLANS